MRAVYDLPSLDVHIVRSSVDWWSFGILMYELVFGYTPFRGNKRDQTFENILKRKLEFPAKPEISPALQVRRGQGQSLVGLQGGDQPWLWFGSVHAISFTSRTLCSFGCLGWGGGLSPAALALLGAIRNTYALRV